MSKPAAEKDDLLLDVQQAYSKTEKYIDENKKSLGIIAGAIVLLVGGYFAWTRLYLAPLEEEAQEKMFWAQQYFENDSLKKPLKAMETTWASKPLPKNTALPKAHHWHITTWASAT